MTLTDVLYNPEPAFSVLKWLGLFEISAFACWCPLLRVGEVMIP